MLQLLLHEDRRRVGCRSDGMMLSLSTLPSGDAWRPVAVGDVPITLLGDAQRLLQLLIHAFPQHSAGADQLLGAIKARRAEVIHALEPARFYYCAAPGCEGRPWPASEHPHLGCAPVDNAFNKHSGSAQ